MHKLGVFFKKKIKVPQSLWRHLFFGKALQTFSHSDFTHAKIASFFFNFLGKSQF